MHLHLLEVINVSAFFVIARKILNREVETIKTTNEINKQSGLPNLDKYIEGFEIRLVPLWKGAILYSMPYETFCKLARKADAVFILRKRALVNLNILDDYIEKMAEEGKSNEIKKKS